MTNSISVAAVILTLNEQDLLPNALQSLAWCDEMVVVDSGSHDKTANVAETFGARFVQHIQKGQFLITNQRNWALRSASINSDWVLFIDADEEVSPELARLIKRELAHNKTYDAYELTPRYWFLGKWLKLTQGYPNWHPRLVKKGSAYFEGGVWESFNPEANIGKIYYPYEHYAFSKGIDDWLVRHIRYSTWEANCIVNYKTSGDLNDLSTSRSLLKRRISASLVFFRPPLRFAEKYIFNLGFLEGWQAFLFSFLMLIYEVLIVVKVIQSQRIKKGLRL